MSFCQSSSPPDSSRSNRQWYRAACRWRSFAGENLADGVSALHSALPDIEHRTELVAVFIHPRHIYNIAAVYQHDGVFKIRSHLVEQRGFIVGQIKLPFLSVFSLSSPAERPITTTAQLLRFAASATVFSSISSHRDSAAMRPRSRRPPGSSLSNPSISFQSVRRLLFRRFSCRPQDRRNRAC